MELCTNTPTTVPQGKQPQLPFVQEVPEPICLSHEEKNLSLPELEPSICGCCACRLVATLIGLPSSRHGCKMTLKKKTLHWNQISWLI